MQIIVWEHKHGTSYYDASTEKSKQASAREIIHNLISVGYIFEPDDEPNLEWSGINFELANLTDDQISALPLQSMREDATREKRRLAARLAEHEREKKEWEEAQKLAAGETVMHRMRNRQTGEIAEREYTPWQFVQNRNGAEYELFSLETVWTPKENS